jgi:hypothetical protein
MNESGQPSDIQSGAWPVNLKKFNVDMPAFIEFLATEKDQGTGSKGDAIRGMCRICHMLEVEGMDITRPEHAEDPALWVSVYVSGTLQKLLRLSVLDVAYTWTKKVQRTSSSNSCQVWDGLGGILLCPKFAIVLRQHCFSGLCLVGSVHHQANNRSQVP